MNDKCSQTEAISGHQIILMALAVPVRLAILPARHHHQTSSYL